MLITLGERGQVTQGAEPPSPSPEPWETSWLGDFLAPPTKSIQQGHVDADSEWEAVTNSAEK